MEQVIIYGAGNIGKKYYEFLLSQHLEHIIYAFCDKNYEKIVEIEEKPVYSYEELKNKGVPFIVAMVDKAAVCEQLENDEKEYYENIESWIKDYRADENKRIKMWYEYHHMAEVHKESEGILNNLGRNMQELTADLKLDRAVKVYGGICPVCKEKTLFISYFFWLRDYYKCLFCGSIPRQRALMRVLEEEVPEWRKLKIHESSPNGSTLKSFKKQCPQYSYSYWYESKALGETIGDGVTNQNLESLTFEDGVFDVFITQDVLEHVNQPEKVFIEIARTLKKGGVHIFTTPMYPFRKTTPRIKMENNVRKCILPPIYHGNPISEEGSLVTFEWGGYDFLKMIDAISGTESKLVEFPCSKENFENGLEGDFLQVIVSKKV